ncbi:MAG: glycosyltransferase family 2 protein [Firmicutes bacterium]|nr:glycosyltransferase family 2 protein [Bacillota bacterium]
MKNRILLIIPAYNEEANIKKTIDKIVDYNKKSQNQVDFIVINDGSKDSTEEILQKNSINHIRLIHNLGIGGAVQTGYKYAYENNYDIAIQYDGDGQHDVNYVDRLIDPIINDNINMVIGSRFIEKSSSDFQSSFMRRVGINVISFVIKIKTKKKIYDTTSGFRAVDNNIIKLFADYYPTEYPEPISTVNVINRKFKVAEVPVAMNEREGGKSSINSWKTIYYMINVILTILLSKRGNK